MSSISPPYESCSRSARCYRSQPSTVRTKQPGAVALLAAAVPLLWPENLDYVGSTLSDAIVGPLLAWVVVKTLTTDKTSSVKPALLAASLVLCFCIRFEIAPALAVLALVILWRLSWQGRLWFAGGIFVALTLAAVLDLSFGQIPFHEFYLNLIRNISDGIAAKYGQEPATAYLEWIEQHWGYALLLAIVLTICEAKRTWLYLIVVAAVLLPLIAIAHKEYRFYYPATLVFTFGLGVAVASFSARYARPHLPVAQIGSAAVVLIAILLGQTPAYFDLAKQGEDLRIVAERAAAQRTDLCGLGSSYGMSVVGTAGLAFLHRQVAFDAVGFSSEEDPTLDAFNYLIVDHDTAQMLGERYSETQCWDGRFKGGLCLYRREGGCRSQAEAELPWPGE